jgi:rhomboid protease GluP
MKIRYNAPVILTLSLACTVIFIISQIVPSFGLLFIVPGNTTAFNFLSLDSFRLFSYVFGHYDWAHLIGNLSILLLAGPILEEKFGSLRMLLMIFFTALVTGLFNVFLLPNPSLGASGIAFMLILLISITNVRAGEIPLTLIAVIAIYITAQIIEGLKPGSTINVWAHLIGGFCGGVFGFIFIREKKKKIQDDTLTYQPPPATGGPGTVS